MKTLIDFGRIWKLVNWFWENMKTG